MRPPTLAAIPLCLFCLSPPATAATMSLDDAGLLPSVGSIRLQETPLDCPVHTNSGHVTNPNCPPKLDPSTPETPQPSMSDELLKPVGTGEGE